MRALVVLGCLVVFAAACGSSSDPTISSESSSTTTEPTPTSETAVETSTTGAGSDEPTDTLFPDVTDAVATPDGENTWRFDVTISSPYDSPDQYADAWRVVGPDGTEYGIRILTHDHAGEQPFTRSQSGIEIPPDVGVVTIVARDLINGWGGGTFELELPSS